MISFPQGHQSVAFFVEYEEVMEVEMNRGRIETYTHSDASTFNKGGAMVRVISQTDFAARTEEFMSFCRLVARFAYGAQAKTWKDVIHAFPDIEGTRINLEKKLKETITVGDIVILNL